MKKCFLFASAACSVLILSACDGKKEQPAPPKPETEQVNASATTPDTKKPAGVPTGTYNKIKGIEQKHNADLEKELDR